MSAPFGSRDVREEDLILEYKGKVRTRYAVSGRPEVAVLRTSDQISVYDKIIDNVIPGKGISLSRSAAHWLRRVDEEGICLTHLLDVFDNGDWLVRRMDVIQDGPVPADASWTFIPLEVICRWYLTGSAWGRHQRGELTAEDLGFEPGAQLKNGMALPQPFVEFTTKFEKFDRNISRDEACQIAGITMAELEEIERITIEIDRLVIKDVATRGLLLVDGKKEFAFGDNREIVLVDAFATADENRWWEMADFEGGLITELSKEFVRQYYVRIGYYERLRLARETGAPEPEIPGLPPELVAEAAELYQQMEERITGVSNAA